MRERKARRNGVHNSATMPEMARRNRNTVVKIQRKSARLFMHERGPRES